jgi:hypothetical protein
MDDAHGNAEIISEGLLATKLYASVVKQLYN